MGEIRYTILHYSVTARPHELKRPVFRIGLNQHNVAENKLKHTNIKTLLKHRRPVITASSASTICMWTLQKKMFFTCKAAISVSTNPPLRYMVQFLKCLPRLLFRWLKRLVQQLQCRRHEATAWSARCSLCLRERLCVLVCLNMCVRLYVGFCSLFALVLQLVLLPLPLLPLLCSHAVSPPSGCKP